MELLLFLTAPPHISASASISALKRGGRVHHAHQNGDSTLQKINPLPPSTNREGNSETSSAKWAARLEPNLSLQVGISDRQRSCSSWWRLHGPRSHDTECATGRRSRDSSGSPAGFAFALKLYEIIFRFVKKEEIDCFFAAQNIRNQFQTLGPHCSFCHTV